jgi:hypothetical protein
MIVALTAMLPAFAWAGDPEAPPVEPTCRVLDDDLLAGYTGSCKHGLAHGEGAAWGAGRYQGAFRDGAKHGWGRKVYSNGDVYTGMFGDNRRHGRGEYLWRAPGPMKGNRYLGEYRDDRREGQGVLLLANGDRYEGPWLNDARLGPTALETQTARYLAALDRAIDVGDTVCREVAVGIGFKRAVAARVVAKSGGLLELQIRPGEAGAQDASITANIVDWKPCGHGQ